MPLSPSRLLNKNREISANRTIYTASYRIPVTIDNTQNSNNLTDYQICITLDTASLISAGKMRSDCGDIRFIDSDGVTMLNYWIESGINTTSTKIWVKIPFIPANSTKTIYLYYGNPDETSLSDGNKTFLLYNDFESGTLEGWNIYNGGGTGTGGVVLLDGRYQLRLYAPNTLNRVQANKAFSSSNAGYAIEVLFKTGSTVGDGILVGFSDGSLNVPSEDHPKNGYLYAIARDGNAADVIEKMYNNAFNRLVSRLNSLSPNTYYRAAFAWFGNSLYAFFNNQLVLTATDTTFSSFSYIFLGVSYYDKYFDWVAVRKYTFPEPTVSLGNEEYIGSRILSVVR
jgi:hypothetical protein